MLGREVLQPVDLMLNPRGEEELLGHRLHDIMKP